MSLREEDRERNGCPSRGLGLAAAAIGVGVGAAMYYFFSKRPELPASEGSTSHQWSRESNHPFHHAMHHDHHHTMHYDHHHAMHYGHPQSDDSFTSLHDGSVPSPRRHRFSDYDNSAIELSSSDSSNSQYSEPGILGRRFTPEYISNILGFACSPSDTSSCISEDSSTSSESSSNLDDSLNMNIGSDPYADEWDMHASLAMPHYEPSPHASPMRRFLNSVQEIREERNEMRRTQVFRERTWSLEECSICFEIILRNQEVMSLPCTHRFHQACILPWLQEQQTCPNCRKNVD